MWIKKICYKNNIQFLGVQESKMTRLELFRINVGERRKFIVWNRLLEFIRNHEGQFVLFGDMNEVRDESERYGLLDLPLKECDDLTKLDDMDMVQKARIKWDVEGDENSKFFHGILKQKRQQQRVKGIMIDGEWITDPHRVKMAFFNFYKDKFEDHDSEMNLGTVTPHVMLDVNGSNELESLVTVNEMKAAIWDCGSQKAPSLDGFSFLFLKSYRELLKSNVEASVRNFLILP
ncbi:hypothetical protein Tco_0721337 [Tanacetum coccineum]